jgi:hypothetical protein
MYTAFLSRGVLWLGLRLFLFSVNFVVTTKDLFAMGLETGGVLVKPLFSAHPLKYSYNLIH